MISFRSTFSDPSNLEGLEGFYKSRKQYSLALKTPGEVEKEIGHNVVHGVKRFLL